MSIAIADKEMKGRVARRKAFRRNLRRAFVSYGLYSSFEPAAVARPDIILHYYFCTSNDLCANRGCPRGLIIILTEDKR